MTDFKRSGISSLRSKLRGIKPAVIERFEPFKLFNRLNQSEVTP
jgi:hypothetical protein